MKTPTEFKWRTRILGLLIVLTLSNTGATGFQWEDGDAIIIEADKSEPKVEINEDLDNGRNKRQVFPGLGSGFFPPGWPFGPPGSVQVTRPQQPGVPQLPQFPQFPSINLQPTQPPAAAPPAGSLGPCLTNNGLHGYCASFRQCYPVLYSPEDGHIMNEGLAEMYHNVSGPCNGHEQPSFFMFRADAELRQSQICCGSGVSQPPLLGYPPMNLFQQITMRPPFNIQTPATTPTTTTTTTQRPTQTTNQWWPPKQSTTAWPQHTWTTTSARPPPPPTTSSPPVSSSCGITKIVGGVQADKGDFPWLISIIRNGRQVCGGSLIDSQYILTAAHCFNGVASHELQSYFKIYIGDWDLHTLSDGPMTVKSISKLILHRQFHQQNFYNDIALIKLDSPVQFGDNGNNGIRPICLSNGGNYEGGTAWVAGWGRLSADQSYQPGIYRKVALTIWNLQQCQAKYGSHAPGGITSQMMCAGQTNRDSCLGDSGGPLMQQVGNRWEQIGLVSWGIGCGAYPGVYTKIADYQDWISRHRHY